ncbi:hypothetical protein BFR47_01975 [Oceanisphaera psychrotolerans]|uniref:Uncharacterized protein n=1 Tax=Oceanisphaera psychrotolerans TaxID=1414654 RepID=A0A1J4QG63_9GAMM|nr:hypothetical protein BFR47_01975 [Oceanisphaera psychrotolerans]
MVFAHPQNFQNFKTQSAKAGAEERDFREVLACVYGLRGDVLMGDVGQHRRRQSAAGGVDGVWGDGSEGKARRPLWAAWVGQGWG